MPSPKVFISSTCYDLGIAREQLRSFLIRLGYDPIMSEYSDVLYDPRTHTHTSCIQEVPNADMIVVLIGARFGGRIVPEALSTIDLENLINSSFDVTVLEEPEKLSITQLEVLKAIDASVPVFAFVDEKVMHDHHVYQKNKDLVGQIKFPSIDKAESAKYIFEFINFLQNRNSGNSVIQFGKLEDIETHLKKQWGGLFQRLLREQRESVSDNRKMFTISEQIDDLKTALLSTIGKGQSREVARGVIKYRRLSDFLSGLKLPNFSIVFDSKCTFEELLDTVQIENIREWPGARSGPMGRSVLIKSDGTFYEYRFAPGFVGRMSVEWQSFTTLSAEARQIIFEAISEMGRMGPSIVRYRNEQFGEYFHDQLKKEDSTAVSLDEFFKVDDQLTADES
ncbi:MAG: hypothetical protein ACI9LY_003456 [Arenicella sp.]|jgi:hypothetical protein